MTAEMIERALRAVGILADEEINLADAALLLGALDMPSVSLERYRNHVERLAGDVAALARAGEPLERRRRHLNAVLYDAHGYAGDAETYDAPENANLLRSSTARWACRSASASSISRLPGHRAGWWTG